MHLPDNADRSVAKQKFDLFNKAESGLKWEAKDSSKLIGNKDHALRGLSSPMVGIRQIRLIT